MAALTRQQVKDLITKTQERFQAIEQEAWDAGKHRYRRSESDMWDAAAKEAVPWAYSDWREIVRVLAQGESYYGGRY